MLRQCLIDQQELWMKHIDPVKLQSGQSVLTDLNSITCMMSLDIHRLLLSITVFIYHYCNTLRNTYKTVKTVNGAT